MLQDKLEVIVGFDELVHVLKNVFRGYTCIDLRGLYVVVTKEVASFVQGLCTFPTWQSPLAATSRVQGSTTEDGGWLFTDEITVK